MTTHLIEQIYSAKSLNWGNLQMDQSTLKEITGEGIGPQVYFLLKSKKVLHLLPEFFRQALKKDFENGYFQNLFIQMELKRILNRFEGLQIEVIPLKGTIFAEKYFGSLGARTTSDIDLLVHQRDLKKAVDAIKQFGFTIEEKRIPGHFHCSYSKNLPGSPVPLTVELHWGIVVEKTARFPIREFWEEAVPIDGFSFVKQFSDYHTFYFICLHGWRHNLDSLKYFIDIIQMIHLLRDTLDYDRLLRDSANHQTRKRMVRTLAIVYQQFPHLNEIKKLPFSKKITIHQTEKAGILRYLDFIDYQFFSYDTARHTLIELRRWIREVYSQKKLLP